MGAAFAGWEIYPQSLDEGDQFDLVSESYSNQLSGLVPVLFTHDPSSTQVRVIDAHRIDEKLRFQHIFLGSSAELETYLSTTENLGMMRIISITQQHSLKPLNITEQLMRKLLSRYSVAQNFLPVLFAFGDQPRASEEGSESLAVQKGQGNTYHLSYQLKYVERNGRRSGNPWSIRQIGIHHRHSNDNHSDFWLILHPVPDSAAQQHLESLFSPLQDAPMVKYSPLKPHIVLLGSYFGNWQRYIRDLGDSFEKVENISLTVELEEDYDLSFTTIQSVRHLEGKIVALRAMFPPMLETIKALQDLNQELRAARSQSEEQAASINNALYEFKCRLEGHAVRAKTLEKGVNRIIQLLADALNLKSQTAAADINYHLLKLTRESVDENTTIRAITLVTMIYLPSSFVATLLGMNLFYFDTSASKMKIAKDFWIFIALALPLTVCTIGYWFFLSHRQEKKRDLRTQRTAGAKKHDEGVGGYVSSLELS